jgi:SulP family sulfate permease
MAFGIASGVKPEAGHLHRHHRRLPDLAARRLAGADRRAGRRLRRAAVRHRRALWPGQPADHRHGHVGVLLFAMGAVRMGSLIRFIPVSIVIGFTNGIAVIIALQQVKDFLGPESAPRCRPLLRQIDAIARNLHSVNPVALALAGGFAGADRRVAEVLCAQRLGPRWRRWRRWRRARHHRRAGAGHAGGGYARPARWTPSAAASAAFRRGCHPFACRPFELGDRANLSGPTVSIALLGAIESLLCARVADGMIDDRHDPNQELMAQGVANFVAPFFGGIAATGTIARTVTNIKSGATHAGGRHHACGHAAADRAGAGAAGGHIPMAVPGRHPDVRGLEHGRLARVRPPAPVLAALPHDHAGHCSC